MRMRRNTRTRRNTRRNVRTRRNARRNVRMEEREEKCEEEDEFN